MKKFLILASATLLALAACNKVQETVVPDEQNKVTELTFTSAKPQLDAASRTTWDGEAIVWEANDKIRIGYTLDGEWMGQSAPGDAKFYASNTVVLDETDNSIGTFSLPVGDNSFTDPQSEGTYQFYAFTPSSLTSSATVSNPEAQTFTIPTSQNPGVGTFDPSADILIGKSAAMDLTGFPSTPIELNWTRLVAHAEITFSHMAFDLEGETVSKITLTFNEDAKVAGSFTANIAAGTAGSGDANTLVLEGNGFVVNENSINVWCAVLPVAFTSLDVEIKTDKATYTRSIEGISGKAFKKNAHNTLTVNMQSADKTENLGVAYELYSGDLTEGVYIIYDADKGVAMKAEVDGNRFKAFSVTPKDGVITTAEESIVWYIAPSGDYWTICNSASEKYAVVNGTDYKVGLSSNASDEKAKWIAEDNYEFKNKSNSKYLRYNPGYGFAGYAKTTGKQLTLYKFDSREPLAAPASVSAALNTETSNAIDVTFSSVTDAATYVITATPTGDGTEVVKSGVTASPATIDGLDYNTEYSISVYAVPDPNDSDHKKSPATEAADPVTTGAKPAAPEGYELITSTDDVTSGLYIIAAKVGNKYYAMPNAFSAGRPTGVEITVTDGVVITSEAADYSLTITKGSTTYTIQGSGKKLLGYSSSTNFNYEGNNTGWTLSTGKNGSFRLNNSTSTDRVIAFNGSVFGAYAASNVTSGSTSYYDVELLKFNGVVKDDPTTTVTPTSPISMEVGETKQLTVDTDSDGAITYESSKTNVATVSSSGLITAVSAGSATITVKTAETESFNAGSTQVTVNVSAGFSTIAQIKAAGTYKVQNAVVMAAKSGVKNFIVSDGTGNIVVYHSSSSHGFVVGDVVTVNGSVIQYGGVWEFDGPTVTKTGTATPSYPTPVEYDAAKIAAYATTQVIEYGHARGLVDGNNVTVAEGKVLNVYGDLSDFNGKTVDVYGYSFGYNSNTSKVSFMQVGAATEYVDPNAPSLSVSPTSASWASGVNDEKTFTVTAENGTWDISAETVSSWATVTKNTTANTIKVTPITAQASAANSGTITITLTPTGSGYASQTATINLSQAKYNDNTTDWSTTYTSNVDLPVSGTSVSSCKVIISGTEYVGTKLGKNGAGASANITIPAGTTKLYVHCASWSGKSVSLSLSTTVSGVTITPDTDWSLTSDTGIANNSPFTLNAPDKAPTDYFKEYTLTGVNSSTTITFKANGERAVFWGVNAK